MKFEKSSFALLLILILFGFGPGYSTGAVEGSYSPENVVKKFYRDYLTAWDEENIQLSLEHTHHAIQIYTTDNLRDAENANDSGADYFTNVQEICPDWVSNINVMLLSGKEDTATVRLILGQNDSESTYLIKLVNENKKWLMDSVIFESRKSSHCNNN